MSEPPFARKPAFDLAPTTVLKSRNVANLEIS